MLDKEKQFKIAQKLKHYFESLVYIELIRLNRKTPVLEFGKDKNSYQTVIKRDVSGSRKGKKYPVKIPLIHIGIDFFDAEDKSDLFWQIHYMLGHETQHARSTVDKDWKAAHMLCLNDACQKLARDVLKKPGIRLVSDKDYDMFFDQLKAKKVFISKNMLLDMIHYIANTLEDGRIENIRCRTHPGFAKYRKLFRGKLWLKQDIRDRKFPKDPLLMSPSQKIDVLFGDMYSLATCSIHQKGFLAVYSDTDLYTRVKNELIPEISKAVLSRSCRGCMESARVIFNRFLDDIIEACKEEGEFMALMQMLAEMLADACSSVQSDYNENANSEDEGDGMPSESVFGCSDLEIEIDEEAFEELKKEMDENGEDPGSDSMSVKISVKDGQPKTEEESNADAEDSSDSACEENCDNGSENAGDETSGEGKGKDSGDEKESSEETESSSESDPQPKYKAKSESSNNKAEEHSEAHVDTDEIEASIREMMQEAAEAAALDMNAAEADAKKAEDVKKAADAMAPVEPAETDLSGLDEKYEDVSFSEYTRCYKPTQVLSFELENKGRSLNNKVDEMIRNKRTPDQRGMRSGGFDASRAHVLLRGELTCYKKRGTYDKPDVAGYILIDNSGSMGNGEGSTRFYACDAAAVIEEGFKNHMPLKIAAFDTFSYKDVTHEIIKEFDENIKPNLSYNFKYLGRGGMGNKDGYSIRVATQQLLARSEKDKVLIIMSDGLPSDYAGGYNEGCRDVRAAVEEARRAGIKTIGMFMYHEQYEEDFAMYRKMYEPDLIFAGMEDIETELERVFKRLFR